MNLTVKQTKNHVEKIRGLIGEKKPYPLLLNTRFGIHTFFLKFPIDVIILDKNNVVKTYKKNLMPYRIFLWNPLYNKVIELPTGTIKKYTIQVEKPLKLTLT